jgi:hypothetical protein
MPTYCTVLFASWHGDLVVLRDDVLPRRTTTAKLPLNISLNPGTVIPGIRDCVRLSQRILWLLIAVLDSISWDSAVGAETFPITPQVGGVGDPKHRLEKLPQV